MSVIKSVVWAERQEGKDKARWHTVGIYIKHDDGKESIKLNTIPAGNWDGWLSIFEKQEKDAF